METSLESVQNIDHWGPKTVARRSQCGTKTEGSLGWPSEVHACVLSGLAQNCTEFQMVVPPKRRSVCNTATNSAVPRRLFGVAEADLCTPAELIAQHCR
eukprot:952835-Amphidinium_carterae.1